MVGASAGPENFRTTHHKDVNLFQGSSQPWLASGLNSGIGKFLHERRDVNANTGSTGTLTRGSGFAEADLALDADFCGMLYLHLTRAAFSVSTPVDDAAFVAATGSYGAPYALDNELYRSIEKIQYRQSGKVFAEFTGADLLRHWRKLPYEEQAKYAKGMGANMSVGERRIRGAASCDLHGPILAPWSMFDTLKQALPLRQLSAPITVRIYFANLNHVVAGPSTTTGGALSAMSLRQDNYHVEADVAAQVALQVARGGYQVAYLEYIRQGTVSITGVSPTVATTTSIQLTNFKRHSFAVECEIQYSDHLQDVFIDNVEDYNLPATYVRLLAGNKQINVEEVYSPVVSCVASPVESRVPGDIATMFPGKPADLVRNLVPLCPPKAFAANMSGQPNNLRQLALYQDLTLQVVTPPALADYTSGGLYPSPHNHRQIGPAAGATTITATALSLTAVSYGFNAIVMEKGMVKPVFSI